MLQFSALLCCAHNWLACLACLVGLSLQPIRPWIPYETAHTRAQTPPDRNNLPPNTTFRLPSFCPSLPPYHGIGLQPTKTGRNRCSYRSISGSFCLCLSVRKSWFSTNRPWSTPGTRCRRLVQLPLPTLPTLQRRSLATSTPTSRPLAASSPSRPRKLSRLLRPSRHRKPSHTTGVLPTWYQAFSGVSSSPHFFVFYFIVLSLLFFGKKNSVHC